MVKDTYISLLCQSPRLVSTLRIINFEWIVLWSTETLFTSKTIGPKNFFTPKNIWLKETLTLILCWHIKSFGLPKYLVPLRFWQPKFSPPQFLNSWKSWHRSWCWSKSFTIGYSILLTLHYFQSKMCSCIGQLEKSYRVGKYLQPKQKRRPESCYNMNDQ